MIPQTWFPRTTNANPLHRNKDDRETRTQLKDVATGVVYADRYEFMAATGDSHYEVTRLIITGKLWALKPYDTPYSPSKRKPK